LGFIIVLSLAGRTRLRTQHARELQEIGDKAREQRSLEIEAQWQACAYSNAFAEHFIDSFRAKIKWSSLDLSDLQKEKLRTRLKEIFLYFQNPGFDEYYRLKTERLHYLVPSSPLAKTPVETSMSKGHIGGEAQPQKTLSAVWNKLHAKGGSGRLPKLAAVCLDSIESETTRTNTPNSLLKGKVGKGLTVAVEAANPGLVYTSVGDPLKPGTEVPIYFHLSFFAKANGSTNAGPVYVSLCWLEEEQEWGLSRLITDQWLGINTVF